MELLTASRATRDVDPQQDSHPLRGCLRLLVSLARSSAEQLAALRQMFLFSSIGQQAVMPNAEETVR